MPIEIVPFSEEHLDVAAELLAARHRAARASVPELPPEYEDPTAARTALAAVKKGGATGVVALDRGRAVGYLVGLAVDQPPLALQSVSVPYIGHVAETDRSIELHRAMYAAAAETWASSGRLTHRVSVQAADRQALEAWFALGFAQETALGIRDTQVIAAASGHPRLEIRRAGPDDVDAIVVLEDALRKYQSTAPMFVPYPSERRAEMPRLHARLLADDRAAYWLTLRDGRAISYQLLAPAPDGSPDLPQNCIGIEHAYTEEDERGSGVGTALLQQGLAWAHEAGYERCVVDWEAPNLLASRFWEHSGFRPLSYWLCRRIDERVARAHER